jgi:hypothetical protein
MTVLELLGDKETMSLVSQILAEESKPGGAFDPNAPSTLTIDDIRTALRGYLLNRQHPEAKYLASGFTLVGLVLAGFAIGKWWRK